MPNDHEQQRMLKAAIASAKQAARTERKERAPKRAKRPDEPAAPEWYCRKCYAELERGKCPRCAGGQQVVSQFCKSCLRVHKNTVKCAAWRPQP